MDTPHIYVACLAAYNCGFLHGAWIDVMEGEDEINKHIYTMLGESPIEGAEEFAVHDYSGFGGVRIDEYESIGEIINIAEFINEHGDLGATLLGEYSIEDAKICIEDHYHGAYESEVDFALMMFEECYGHAVPEHLSCYIDYEAFSRDLFINDYFSVKAQGQTHVFSPF